MKERSRKSVPPELVKEELLPGQSPELLKTLHLLDRTGRLHADARRKLKQINHLVNLLTPALDDVLKRYRDPVIVDACTGNAYLAFIVHEIFLKKVKRGILYAIESRPDLAARVRERRDKLECSGMKTVEAELKDADLPERVHMMMALHACDTATDEAILQGIRRRSDYIAIVPCCQAEVAGMLSGQRAEEDGLGNLWRNRLHRREFGALLTNVIRTLVLESRGYKVTVTEFVGWEHSLKNELILAGRVHRENLKATRSLEELMSHFPEVSTHLLRGLED